MHPAAHAKAQHGFGPGQGEADAQDTDDPGVGKMQQAEGQAARTEPGAQQPGKLFWFDWFLGWF